MHEGRETAPIVVSSLRQRSPTSSFSVYMAGLENFLLHRVDHCLHARVVMSRSRSHDCIQVDAKYGSTKVDLIPTNTLSKMRGREGSRLQNKNRYSQIQEHAVTLFEASTTYQNQTVTTATTGQKMNEMRQSRIYAHPTPDFE